jgi:hypothetical protein
MGGKVGRLTFADYECCWRYCRRWRRAITGYFGQCLREAWWSFCGGNDKRWRCMADICLFRNFRLKISEAVFPRVSANFAAISAIAKGQFRVKDKSSYSVIDRAGTRTYSIVMADRRRFSATSTGRYCSSLVAEGVSPQVREDIAAQRKIG